MKVASQSIGILLAEIKRLNRLLESLTPGGSEFHDNPEYCVEWAKSWRESNWKIAKKAIIRSRELEGEVKRLRNLVEIATHAMYAAGWDRAVDEYSKDEKGG